MSNQAELGDMPDVLIGITYRYKITDTTAYLDELPKVGAPKKFPPVTVGNITQIVEKNDKAGNPIAIITVTQGPTP